jgi:hypothetical protein
MNYRGLNLEVFFAFVGGCLGASVSGLGGFVLFGLCGVIGFLCLALANQDAGLVFMLGGYLFKPSVCFLGGVVAAAYARKQGLITCGKDLGRPLVRLRRLDVLLVGGLAGIAGSIINRLLERGVGGKLDAAAMTVFAVSMAIKYAFGLSKSSDCAAASHAVHSPYRFFERLARPAEKTGLSLLIGLAAATLTWRLCLDPRTVQFAGLLAFCISAVILCFLYLSVPVPATHHFSGPAAVAVITWMACHGGIISGGFEVLVVLLWGVAAAQFSMLSADAMGRLFFDEGDMHVDPPAMGIMLSTAVIMGVLPFTGMYLATTGTQVAVSACFILACATVNLRVFGRRH